MASVRAEPRAAREEPAVAVVVDLNVPPRGGGSDRWGQAPAGPWDVAALLLDEAAYTFSPEGEREIAELVESGADERFKVNLLSPARSPHLADLRADQVMLVHLWLDDPWAGGFVRLHVVAGLRLLWLTPVGELIVAGRGCVVDVENNLGGDPTPRVLVQCVAGSAAEDSVAPALAISARIGPEPPTDETLFDDPPHEPVACNNDADCGVGFYCLNHACVSCESARCGPCAEGRPCINGECHPCDEPQRDPCCTAPECCGDSRCQGPCACLNCDDGNACTDDRCEGGSCRHATRDCADDDARTIDGCDPASGCTHEPKDCGDGNDCPQDTCNSVTGACVHTWLCPPPTDPCTVLACTVYGCNYPPKNCDDGNLCTTDACIDGECLHEWNCPDPPSDPCQRPRCANGHCQYAALTCDDGNPCTVDWCGADGWCHNEPKTCDDGNGCTRDTCRDGGCFHEWTCDGGDPYTIDECVEKSCVHTPKVCDDGDLWTDDSCNPLTGDCVFQPQGVPERRQPLHERGVQSADRRVHVPARSKRHALPGRRQALFGRRLRKRSVHAPGYV